MSHNLINLLPEDRIRAWRRDYFIRLATVGIFLVILLTIIHGTLLFPSYLSLYGKRAAEAAELARLQKNLVGSKQAELHTRLLSLKGDATYLAKLGTVSSVSSVMRALLLVPRTGITLTTFTVTPSSEGEANGRVTLSGIATTRETLRAYNLALSELPFISSVDLPISSYAEESDIMFTMTLTGKLIP